MPWKVLEPMNQRVEFATRSLGTENFRALCQEYGISTKTGYKWQKRFLRYGASGMAEESRRPKSSPAGLPEQVVCEMVRIKNRYSHWGPKKVRRIYERLHGSTPSESSFKRVLARAGLTQARRSRPAPASGRLHSERRAQAANEIWTVDFKGSWHGCGGNRCEPLTVRDEWTRYVLEVRLLDNGSTAAVRTCFERLFEGYGLPGSIRSDNGSPFASASGVLGLSRLSAWWLALGIDLERGRPGCPQDNGAHERLHADMGRELESKQVDTQAALEEWRQEFNQERPHEALGMRCPAEVYVPSTRKYEGTPEDLVYPGMAQRKVGNAGCIGWRDERVFISTALNGWSVGLEASQEERWNVWFGRLLLGELDEHELGFTRIDRAQASGATNNP